MQCECRPTHQSVHCLECALPVIQAVVHLDYITYRIQMGLKDDRC